MILFLQRQRLSPIGATAAFPIIDITVASFSSMTLLHDLLADIAAVENVLFVVKSGGATAEVRSHMGVRESGKWITVGDSDGPAHMHVNSEQVASAEFIKEKRPERTSFSVRFFDPSGRRVLAAFFSKMYDEDGNQVAWRSRLYEELCKKYSEKITFSSSAAAAAAAAKSPPSP